MDEERDSYGRRALAAAYANGAAWEQADRRAREARQVTAPTPSSEPTKKIDPNAMRTIEDIAAHLASNRSAFLVVPRGDLQALLDLARSQTAAVSGMAPALSAPIGAPEVQP